MRAILRLLKKNPYYSPIQFLKATTILGRKNAFFPFFPCPSNDSAFSSDAAGILLDDAIFRRAREKDGIYIYINIYFYIFWGGYESGWKIISVNISFRRSRNLKHVLPSLPSSPSLLPSSPVARSTALSKSLLKLRVGFSTGSFDGTSRHVVGWKVGKWPL